MAINRPNNFYISLNDKVHKNRIVIPFYDDNRKIIHYQTRTILEVDELTKQHDLNFDKDKIHLLFFDYSLKQNWFSKPFLIIFKLFFRMQGKPAIDHVCHISRFIYNNETGDWNANIFESTLHGGVQEVNLFDKFLIMSFALEHRR